MKWAQHKIQEQACQPNHESAYSHHSTCPHRGIPRWRTLQPILPQSHITGAHALLECRRHVLTESKANASRSGDRVRLCSDSVDQHISTHSRNANAKSQASLLLHLYSLHRSCEPGTCCRFQARCSSCSELTGEVRSMVWLRNTPPANTCAVRYHMPRQLVA